MASGVYNFVGSVFGGSVKAGQLVALAGAGVLGFQSAAYLAESAYRVVVVACRAIHTHSLPQLYTFQSDSVFDKCTESLRPAAKQERFAVLTNGAKAAGIGLGCLAVATAAQYVGGFSIHHLLEGVNVGLSYATGFQLNGRLIALLPRVAV